MDTIIIIAVMLILATIAGVAGRHQGPRTPPPFL